MKILITGDAGFLASRVMDALFKAGYDVVGYDKVRGDDLLDLAHVEDVVSGVDVVFHIAGEADSVKMSNSLPAGRAGVLNNVDATHNIAYACAKHRKWIIFSSTICVYGNSTKYVEIPSPVGLYACSKYVAELLIKGYGSSHGLPWTIQRYSTVYGPGINTALTLHKFFKQAINNEPIMLYGDGNQEKTMVYVDDMIQGIISVLEHPEDAKNEIFNLSNTVAIPVRQIVEDIIAISESSSEIVMSLEQGKQTTHGGFTTKKTKDLLHWEATTSWEYGLKETYHWMKSHYGR